MGTREKTKTREENGGDAGEFGVCNGDIDAHLGYVPAILPLRPHRKILPQIDEVFLPSHPNHFR